ncbi:MAG: hypothetical protein ACRYFW_00880 [Janthinobacterium lividum]
MAFDVPTSWGLAAITDEFTDRMFAAVNSTMWDVLAAVAREDYEPGVVAKKKEPLVPTASLYKRRPENKARNAAIATMLRDSYHGAKS